MKPTHRKTRSWRKATFVGLLSLGLTSYPSIAKAQSTASFVAVGNMTTARAGHTATLLTNGKVLIVGGGASAELYDPTTKIFTATGNMTTARSGHTATLLDDGRVLIAGGAGSNGITSSSAELYDPLTETFSRTANMISARWGHTGTLLKDGTVLIAGGIADSSFTNAEIYNPSSGAFTTTGDMIRPKRSGHTATLLHDGRVLIVGADGESPILSVVELYDPSTRTFSRTEDYRRQVQGHTATLLYDGRVLIAGGEGDTSGWSYTLASLFDPSTGSFMFSVDMNGTGPNKLFNGRVNHTSTLLRDGRVLMAGSFKCSPFISPQCSLISDASTEIYDPVTHTFSLLENMTVPRSSHTATLLSDGTVLIAGGYSGLLPYEGGPQTATAEIYSPFANLIGLDQPGIITTYAGPSPPVDGAQAVMVSIKAPTSAVPDGAGGFYVASNQRVYRVTSDGRIRAVAGSGNSGHSGDGGIATSAQLSDPHGVAVDTAGNLYIADSGNNRIRKVTLDGVIQTVAGNGTYGFSGDGGLATSAQLNSPNDVAVDTTGNLYIADSLNNRIRKVTLDGVIQTIAGSGTFGGFSGDGGLAPSAQLFEPRGIAMDAGGNLYIADSMNNRIRKLTLDGVIQTIAGNSTIGGFSGDGGLATSAQLNSPNDVAVDTTGNLYIADSLNNRIRKVTLDGVIQTVTGNTVRGLSGDGGLASSASLFEPRGIAMDAGGNLYIADFMNSRIRKVTLDGVIQTVAGNGTFGFSGDGGPASAALFNFPLGIAMDAGGNLYIADLGNNRVRKVTPGRVISTVAGNGIPAFSGDGGAATDAQLRGPYGVAVDAAGNLYIAEHSNHIRRVTPDGVIRTIAGNGIAGFSGDGGPATSASFSSNYGIAVDPGGNLYIADSGNGRVRKVTTEGVISTIYVGSVNSDGIAVDAIGNLYMAADDWGVDDFYSGFYTITVRKMSPDGVSRIVYSARNPGCCATSGIAVDSSGNIYLFYGDGGGPVIKITPAGVYSLVAGDGGFGTAGDGGLSTLAQFYRTSGIAVDAAGNLFVTDGARIRKVVFGLILSGVTPNSSPRGNAVQVSLNGTNFDSSLVINPIAGITVSNLTIVSPTLATAIFTIEAAAVPGARDLTVTTSGGTSNAITFAVNPPPSLSLLTPPVGVPGTSVAMILIGTGFDSGFIVDAGSEITVSNISVTSSTSAVATFTISPSALLGTHDVTVTTSSGTSAPAVLNVVLPFPDLTIVSTHATTFGVGFTETYKVLVRNVGLVPTTGIMTLTDVLPSGFAYASGGGAAWSCSAAGQAVTCVHSGTLGPDESTTLDIAVVVSSAAAPGVVHSISVATAGDVNPSNDSAADMTAVAPTPVPIFVINPSPIRAGSQATLGLTLTNAFPHDVTGELTMGFSSNAAIPLDDPALQFASGGRQTTFVIPANAMQARIGGNSVAGPVGFQAGTVAGALSFSGTLHAGTVQTTISPSSSVASSLTIPRQAPLIQNVETSTQNGFAVLIHLLSTSREVTQLILTFNTTPTVTLNCGSVSGCSASGPTMSFNVRSLFDAWFSSDSVFGSLSTLQLPFSISGTVHGTVTVRLQNSMGISSPKSFPLP